MKIVRNYLRYIVDLFNPKIGKKIYLYKATSLWVMIIITAIIISAILSSLYTSEIYSFVGSINNSNFASFRLTSNITPKRDMDFGFAYFSSGKDMKKKGISNVSNISKNVANVSPLFSSGIKARISESALVYNNTLYYASFPCFSDKWLCQGNYGNIGLNNLSLVGNKDASRDRVNLASKIVMNGFLAGAAIVIFILGFAFIMAYVIISFLLASLAGFLFVFIRKSSIGFRTVMKISLFLVGILELLFAVFWILFFHSLIVPFIVYAIIVLLVLFIESSNRDLIKSKKKKRVDDDA